MQPEMIYGLPLVTSHIIPPTSFTLPNAVVKNSAVIDVSQFPALFVTVNSGGDPQLCQVEFDFLDAAVSGNTVSTYRILVDSTHKCWTYIPCASGYVRITVNALGGGNAALSVFVTANAAPAGMSPKLYNPGQGQGIIAVNVAALAPSGIDTEDLLVTTPGVYQLNLGSSQTGLSANIEQEFTNGVWTQIARLSVAATIGQIIGYVVAAPTRVRVQNSAAAAADISIILTPSI